MLMTPLLSFAQSYTIEYDVTLNVIGKTGVLNFNKNDRSFYYEVPKEIKVKEEKSQEIGFLGKSIIIGQNTNTKRIQIYKKDIDTLINVDYLEGKEIICTEKFPLMDWKLESETKLVSNYLCSKATTLFRGRKYIAWYCSDLPIQVGPWKFNNLPGAIFQIYDETNSFAWTIVKIVKNVDDTKLVVNKNLKQYTLKEFIERDEISKNEIGNQAILKYTERGATIISESYNRGREKKFEWEK